MLLCLAPMDGITDCPYRLIVKNIFEKYKNKEDKLRTWTEFMSADWYMINPSRLIKHLIKTDQENNLIAQIYGWTQDTLIKTAQDIANKYPSFAGIELNIGCPSPKIMACGAGASMMNNKKNTLEIIKNISKSTSLPFSIKTRLWLNEHDKEQQYQFIVEASQYCSTISIHARTFQQWHSWHVDRETLYKLRGDIHTNCILIGNGGISSYQDAINNSNFQDNNWDSQQLWIMIGQAAIGNPWIFTTHEPSPKERLQTCLDHLYLMSAYEVYLSHTREQFPEMSDQLMLNRKHLHMIKKYNPDSDEMSDLPYLDHHDYIFPMPSYNLLEHYADTIKNSIVYWKNKVDFGTFLYDTDTLRTGIDIRKYFFNYIQWIPNNKIIKQALIQNKKVSEIVKILESF